MEFYEKETNFRNKPQQHPVIVLLDNDPEATNAINFIKGKYGHADVDYDRSKILMYHVVHNLYLVLMPLINGQDSKIEDFFDKKLLETTVGGKKFRFDNKQSGDNEENGKYIFATKVVKANQDKIDFSNFQPILSNISLAIEDYKLRTK